MSRFGKLPVEILEGVTITTDGGELKVVGPKGSIERDLPREVKIKLENKEAHVESKSEVMKGTYRSHLVNMIKGVSTGWSKSLELVGTGYRAEVRGRDLVLTVGYSHPVVVPAPEGINFTVEKSIVKIEGINKEVVGQVSAFIIAVRPPDAYKGKGIRLEGQVLKLKPGKQAAKTTV